MGSSAVSARISGKLHGEVAHFPVFGSGERHLKNGDPPTLRLPPAEATVSGRPTYLQIPDSVSMAHVIMSSTLIL